ncbi:MAG: hypothetical protein NVSMB57_14580 [Actinomycetota bacterium]
MRANRTPRLIALVASAAALLTLAFIVSASLTNVGVNVGVGVGRRPSFILDEALPQSWALFSYDPRSPVFLIFRREQQEWRQITPGWTTFAFSRRSRGSEVEAQTLGARIPADAWRRCTTPARSCALQNQPVITLRAFSHTFCGQLAFIRTSAADPGVTQSADVAKVSLLC